MSDSALREKFIEEIALILELDKDELRGADFEKIEGFDSLAVIRIAIKIEDFFDLRVSSEEILNFKNVEEMMSFLESEHR